MPFLYSSPDARYWGTVILLLSSMQTSYSCPLSVESLPHGFRVGKTCPHDLTWGNCEVCNCSQTEKRDVIDIELVDVAQYWLQKKAYKEKIRTFFNQSDDDYDEDEEYYNNEFD